LNSLAGGIVHAILIATFFAWSGNSVSKAFKVPSGSKVLIGIAVVAALSGVVVATKWGRRKLAAPLARSIRTAVRNLRVVSKSPTKLTLLFGGSTLVTIAYIAAFAGAVAAFGGGLSLAEVGTVYLGATAVAAAAPTPGNLGALEAALVAGLTGLGMPAGGAVSAVLTYRLATYWLPVVPGWVSWVLIQRWNYV
jgi:glycosyltransferase 2 family protein